MGLEWSLEKRQLRVYCLGLQNVRTGFGMKVQCVTHLLHCNRGGRKAQTAEPYFVSKMMFTVLFDTVEILLKGCASLDCSYKRNTGQPQRPVPRTFADPEGEYIKNIKAHWAQVSESERCVSVTRAASLTPDSALAKYHGEDSATGKTVLICIALSKGNHRSRKDEIITCNYSEHTKPWRMRYLK